MNICCCLPACQGMRSCWLVFPGSYAFAAVKLLNHYGFAMTHPSGDTNRRTDARKQSCMKAMLKQSTRLASYHRVFGRSVRMLRRGLDMGNSST